nr:ATP synthase F0 subunit 8 [Zootermopsis nevadensis]WHM51540.1 ATP synthase F0 subunit 8 [Zootermopsis nevadensis]WNR50548.1 ATP synthase F0 subunit 8 [Zootermopsis nevadensis]
MPQMMPLSWLILFISFSTIFVMFNTMNYFSFTQTNKKMQKKIKLTKKTNWKW